MRRNTYSSFLFQAALFILFLVEISPLNAQVVSLGSGTSVNGTTASSPVNIWYRRCVSQTVYTKSELNSAGISGPATIRQIGYYVTQAPLYAIPNYQISIKHTTATNASGNLEGGYTVVKNAFDYAPEAGGWDMLSLDTPFNWNGTNNIVVRICWTQVQPDYDATGQCRVYNASNGYKYRWDDNSGGACGLVPNTTNNNKPQIQFIFDTITVWTGAVNTVWNNANNWTRGVPNAYMDAKIPAGTAHDPNINNNASCEELILEGNLSMSANKTLTVYSHFTSTGIFTDAGGTTIMSGDGASTMSGVITFTNLHIASGGGTTVTSGTINITEELQVNNSTFNTGNALVLKSTASQTARIAELKSYCTYSLHMNDSYGDGWNGGYLTVLDDGVSIGTFSAVGYGSVETFTVESGSAISVQYTSGSWETENSFYLQDGSGTTIYNDNAPIAAGTVYSGTSNCSFTPLVSGNITMERYIDAGATYWRNFSSAVSGATVSQYLDDFLTAGFPGSPWPAFPFNSIYTYDETLGAGDGWIGCTGTSQVIGVAQGLFVWSGDTITGTDPFLVDLSGPANQGPITFPVTYTNFGVVDEDGWNLVGNPYPSAIDWDSPKWTKVNMADAIYIQDPDNQQFASYVSGASTNGGSNLIASQQSFWVMATGTSPQLISREAVKSDVDAPFFKTGGLSPGMSITLSGDGYTDESVLRQVDGATLAYDPNYDAVERWGGWGTVPQLSLVNDSQQDFAIHSFDMSGNEWIVPLRAVVFTNGPYDLVFENVDELDVPCLKLEDLYTGITYDISEGTTLTFDMSDTTWDARFLLYVGRTYQGETLAATCFGGSDGEIHLDLLDTSAVDYILYTDAGSVVGSASGDPLIIGGLLSDSYTLEIPSLTDVCDQHYFQFSVSQAPEIVTTVTTNDELNGADGAINLSVNGGTPPYTFNWSSGQSTEDISGLVPGAYEVLVIDALGCESTNTFFVNSQLGLQTVENTPVFTYLPQQHTIRISDVHVGNQLFLYDVAGKLQTSFYGA